MPAAVDPRQHVVPPGTRRAAAVAAGVGVAVLVVFGLRYRGESQPRWLDTQIQDAVDDVGPGRSPWLHAVVLLGSPPTVVVLAFLLAGVALHLGRRRLALVAVLGPGLTGVATTTLKPVIGRTLDGEFAFPSGHTGGATALAVVTALLFAAVLRTGHRAGTALILGAPLLMAVALCLAMTAGHWHYPTDAVGGAAAAVAVVLGIALVVERATAARHPGPASTR